MSLNKDPSLSKRSVLGRGLDSLFSPSSPSLEKKRSSQVKTLGIEQIYANPKQPRQVFDKELLNQLAISIKENGLIQPIVVRAVSDSRYEIIAGERRWRACALAGLYEVPVRILEMKKNYSYLPLVENLQRENLNPLELAEAYKVLMEKENKTQEELAHKLGIPRATLANHLRLLNLSPTVQNFLLQRKLTFALAKILLQESDPVTQTNWAQYFIKHKVDVRTAEKLLSKGTKNLSSKQKFVKLKEEEIIWQKTAIHKLQKKYDAKSLLRFKKKGGELCFRFFSNKELESLFKKLLQD